MTGVETIARIRVKHYQNRKRIKRIARELGLARDTVRKVLRSNATAFAYKRAVQPQPKLGPWIAALTAILEAEAKLPKRERRSTLRLFEELRGRGYDGAHDSVHRFVRTWRAERARLPVQALCRCGLILARPTSSTGATRASSSTACRSPSRLPRCGSPTAACRSCAPTFARPRRWSSTPTTALSRSTAAYAGAASTTT